MYGGFDVGLSGILTLVDGQLLSFEPEEGSSLPPNVQTTAQK
jgi:hypothetical protein